MHYVFPLLNKSTLMKRNFPSLRYVTQAGGAMAPSIQKKVARAFAPANLYIMYGATEASARLSYLDPKDLKRKWGSIGKAIPNVDLFVADPEGAEPPPADPPPDAAFSNDPKATNAAPATIAPVPETAFIASTAIPSAIKNCPSWIAKSPIVQRRNLPKLANTFSPAYRD